MASLLGFPFILYVPAMLFTTIANSGDLGGEVREGTNGNAACWKGAWSWESCCHPDHGARGNRACWGGSFTYSRCCFIELRLGRRGKVGGLRLELSDEGQKAAVDSVRRWDLECVLFALKTMVEGIFDQNVLANTTVYIVSDMVHIVARETAVSQMPLQQIKSLEALSPSAIIGSVFVPFFRSDDELSGAVDAIERGGGRFFPPIFNSLAGCWESYEIGRGRFLWTDQHAHAAVSLGVDAGIVQGWGSMHAHEALCQALAATRKVAGSVVEIGVFKGYSAMTMLRYLRLAGIKRKMYLFDTYDGFSYPRAYTSADGQWAGTLKVWATFEEAIAQLRQQLQPLVGSGSELVMERLNVVSTDLPPGVGPIAVANVDVDMLEATEAALVKVAPLVAVGGMIHCDDPSATPMTAGALLGMERFLNSAVGQSFVKLMLGSQYVLVKVNI